MFNIFIASAFTVFLLVSSPYGYATDKLSLTICKSTAISNKSNTKYLFPPADKYQKKVTKLDLHDFDNLIGYLENSLKIDFQRVQTIETTRAGGLIAKVETASGDFTLKQVLNHEEIENDVLSFEVMKLFLNDNPDISVRVVNYEHLPDFGFKMEYVPGITMEHIGYEYLSHAKDVLYSLRFNPIIKRIEESNVPLDVATQAFENYGKFQIRFETWIQEQFPRAIKKRRYQMYSLNLYDIRKRDEIKGLLALANQSFMEKINPLKYPMVRVFPHSKNILVDARDGSLVLIDPF